MNLLGMGLQRTARLTAAFCVATASAACAQHTKGSAKTGNVVPPVAPDTVPAWMKADSSLSADRLFTKRIVVVFFRDGTAQAKRQAAIELVGGIVVGGARIFTGDGYYYVRVEDDGTAKQLRRAVAHLSALPQVENASLDYRVTGR